MPVPDFLTQRESLNDEITSFIQQQTPGCNQGLAEAKPHQEMIMTIEKPKDDSRGVVSGQKDKDKAERYAWAPIQGEPPSVQMLSKAQLYIDRGYQRDARPSDSRVRQIAAMFSWHKFAALTVSKRGGRYMVVDGQNRLLACMKRREIDLIPCVIQSHYGKDADRQSSEAAAFLGINTTGKGVCAFDKHRAGLVAKDEGVITTQAAFDAAGVVLVKNSRGPNESAAAAETLKLVKAIGKDPVARCLSVCKNMGFSQGIPARAILAVSYLFQNIKGGPDERLVAKLIAVGGDSAEVLMQKMILVAGKAGPRITSEALRQEINKGLRQSRYEFK